MLTVTVDRPRPAQPVEASHFGNINAIVRQWVDNYGSKSTIETGDPQDVYWWLGDFSFMRTYVEAFPENIHSYGELGWYRGKKVGSNAIKVFWVYKNASGKFDGVWQNSPTLSAGSRHEYKVANAGCFDNTTIDNSWDFCFNNQTVLVQDLGFQVAQSVVFGGEVGNIAGGSHGIGMGPSWMEENQYKPINATWKLTDNVGCDNYDPATNTCSSNDDSRYKVTNITVPNDSTWRVLGP